jgi:hypothetical protein
MNGPNALLAGLLLIAALIAATDRYAALIRRRDGRRRDERQAQADQEASQRNMVRLGLVDPSRPATGGLARRESRRTSRWLQRWRGLSSTPSSADGSLAEGDDGGD